MEKHLPSVQQGAMVLFSCCRYRTGDCNLVYLQVKIRLVIFIIYTFINTLFELYSIDLTIVGIRFWDALLYTYGQLMMSHGGVMGLYATEISLTVLMSVFALLISSVYSGCIVSRLTLPLYSTQVDTLRQMVETGVLWGKTFRGQNSSNYLNLQVVLGRYFIAARVK